MTNKEIRQAAISSTKWANQATQLLKLLDEIVVQDDGKEYQQLKTELHEALDYIRNYNERVEDLTRCNH